MQVLRLVIFKALDALKLKYKEFKTSKSALPDLFSPKLLIFFYQVESNEFLYMTL